MKNLLKNLNVFRAINTSFEENILNNLIIIISGMMIILIFLAMFITWSINPNQIRGVLLFGSMMFYSTYIVNKKKEENGKSR